MNKCPRCSADVSANSKVCSKCGLSVNKMEEFASKMTDLEYGNPTGNSYSQGMTKQEKKAAKKQRKEEKKRLKKERKIRESKSDTDFSVYALNNKEGVRSKRYDNNYFGRRQKRKDKSKFPEFTIDLATGEYNIDTSDVEIVGEKTGRIIEEQHQSYSVKKSRGDYSPARIKWWELYKLADRYFARRKIKRQVNCAAKIKPGFINKTKLLFLAILFGWMGAHNFYAKNYKRGYVSIAMLFISVGIISFASYVPFFASIQISVGGFTGFINLFMWISDIINISFNTYKYRLQKVAFLEKLNFNTRSKLGEKYYDMELYQKPWWVRLKVWAAKKKRRWQERRHDSRQRKIERKKNKDKAKKEKAEIDSEIFRAEAMEENLKMAEREKEEKAEAEKLAKMRSKALDSETLLSINSFDGGLTKASDSSNNGRDNNKPLSKSKQAKVKVKSKNKGKKK